MSASNADRFLYGSGTDALGNTGNDSGNRGLALKMFEGKVLTAFRMNTVFYDMMGTIISKKTVGPQGGKSWQAMILGDDPIPEYHNPGDELLGQQQAFNEIIVTIDDIMVSHRDVPLDQQIISQFDVLGKFGESMGRALAIDLDSKIAIMGIKAARTAASTGFHFGGTRVTRTAATLAAAYPVTSTGAFNFRDDLSALAQYLDEKNVPKAGRWAFIPPYMHRVLGKDGQTVAIAAGSTLFSKDYGESGNDVNRRIVRECEGFNIVVSNNLPDADYSASGTTTYATGAAFTTGAVNRANLGSITNPTKYLINGSSTTGTVAAKTGQPAALILCGASDGQGAVAMVEGWAGINTKIVDDDRRNTTFMKAQDFFGLGVYCPWMAGEICVSAA